MIVRDGGVRRLRAVEQFGSEIDMDTRTTRNGIARSLVCAGVLVFLPLACATAGEPQHDFVVFASVEGFDRFDSADASLDEFDSRFTGDFLYTYSGSRFRFLAEFIASSHETEMERLQAAWLIDEHTALWLGRFHSVAKFWTSEFHHGQFLQNSISRPKLEEWEDEYGPMPAHITGLLFERKLDAGDAGEWSIAAGGGIGPKFVGDRLKALDIFDPESGHKGALNFNLTYRPEVLSTTQVGFVAAWSDIAVDSVLAPGFDGLGSAHQVTAGLFADWSRAAWRVMGHATWFRNELRFVDRKEIDDFVLAYLQAEYSINEDWTVFGRIETGPDEAESRYLAMFPEFVANREMLGIRWDIVDNHSLSAEIASTGNDKQPGSELEYKEFRLQWSAVFR